MMTMRPHHQRRRRLLLLLLLICCHHRHASPFAPGGAAPSQRRRYAWFILAASSTGETTTGASKTRTTKDDELLPSRKDSALKSLERMLDRQKEELERTERLVTLLRNTKEHEEENTSAIIKGSDPAELQQSIQMTKSVLSGVNYGFVSRSEGARSPLEGGCPFYVTEGTYYGPPGNLLTLGIQQFQRNWKAIRGQYDDEVEATNGDEASTKSKLSKQQKLLQSKLQQLTLNSTEIWKREFADGPLDAPWIIKLPYFAVCFLLDVVFENRYVPARFFLLETVARMPYFSYITMLHLYETTGLWRRSAEMKRVHFAEELNEYQHLLIMESLGGDQEWWVRALAQHAAVVYYVVLCFLWALSPSLSYQFSELLETHAVNTYGVFLDENERMLKELPPSLAAVEYYCFNTADPFYAEFQTSAFALGTPIRRPGEDGVLVSLYDVFTAIRADEGDHVFTMQACLDPSVAVPSASAEKRLLTGASLLTAAAVVDALTGGAGFLEGNSIEAGDVSTQLSVAAGPLLESVQQIIDNLLQSGF